MQHLLIEIGTLSQSHAVPLHVDTMTEASVAHNRATINRRKHVDIHAYHVIHHHEKGNMDDQHISSTQNNVNLLIKSLQPAKFQAALLMLLMQVANYTQHDSSKLTVQAAMYSP